AGPGFTRGLVFTRGSVVPAASLRRREMPLNNNCPRASLLLIALAAALTACGGKKEPEVLIRPVRSEVVTGGSSTDSATYTAEIRSRYETDLSFQVGGKL